MIYSRSNSLIYIIATAVSLAGCGSTTSTTSTTPAAAPVTKKASGAEITLNSVELRHDIKPAGFIADAPTGAIYVVASYSLKNTGVEPLGFENWPQPRLVDPQGHQFEPEIGASTYASAAVNIAWAENLNPNLSTSPKLVWKVDEKGFDLKTWTLVFAAKPQLTFKLQ